MPERQFRGNFLETVAGGGGSFVVVCFWQAQNFNQTAFKLPSNFLANVLQSASAICLGKLPLRLCHKTTTENWGSLLTRVEKFVWKFSFGHTKVRGSLVEVSPFTFWLRGKLLPTKYTWNKLTLPSKSNIKVKRQNAKLKNKVSLQKLKFAHEAKRNFSDFFIGKLPRLPSYL